MKSRLLTLPAVLALAVTASAPTLAHGAPKPVAKPDRVTVQVDAAKRVPVLKNDRVGTFGSLHVVKAPKALKVVPKGRTLRVVAKKAGTFKVRYLAVGSRGPAAATLRVTVKAPKRAAVKTATKRTASTCTKPMPDTAAGWEQAFRDLGGQYAFGDQGTSVALPDGRQLFMLGDTVQGTLTPTGGVTNWTMPHSTFVLADQGCLTIHKTTNQGMIPNASNGDYYWPASAVVSNGKLYVFAHRIRAGNGTFSVIDKVLTEFTLPTGGVPTFKKHLFSVKTATSAEPILWGAGSFVKDGYAYIYGNKVVHGTWVWGRDVHVARVPVGQVATKSSWRYWNGSSWGTNAAAAATTHPALNGIGSSISPYFDNATGKYVLVGKKNDMLGAEIVALTSPNPYGPWAEQVLHLHPYNNGNSSYSPMAHPQIPMASGKTFITYSRNHTSGSVVLQNIELGRFAFIEAAVN